MQLNYKAEMTLTDEFVLSIDVEINGVGVVEKGGRRVRVTYNCRCQLCATHAGVG